ncbi:MAG: type IV pilin protein [Methylococcaceae bacterium]
MRTKIRGFTLIELMITVAIIGILASIAIPSYSAYITKGKRAEAQGALVTFANAMEQWRLQNSSYCGAAGTGCVTGSPTIFSTVVPINVPANSSAKTYDLTVSAVTATTYTLTATATGTQAADGNLSLTSAGTKTCTKNSACLNGTSW